MIVPFNEKDNRYYLFNVYNYILVLFIEVFDFFIYSIYIN